MIILHDGWIANSECLFELEINQSNIDQIVRDNEDDRVQLTTKRGEFHSKFRGSCTLNGWTVIIFPNVTFRFCNIVKWKNYS